MTTLANMEEAICLLITIETKLPAVKMVRKAIQHKIEKFTKQDIRELCPSWKREGSGKATYYTRLR